MKRIWQIVQSNQSIDFTWRHTTLRTQASAILIPHRVRQQTEFRCQCQATTMPVGAIAGCTNRREKDTGRKLVLQLQLTYHFERPRWQYERPECREKKTMAWKAAVNRKNNGAKRLFVQGILLTVREFCCCFSGRGGGGGVVCLFVFVGFFVCFLRKSNIHLVDWQSPPLLVHTTQHILTLCWACFISP